METNKDSIVDVRSMVEAISSDDNDAPLYQVESLCMRCRQNGTTRFLLTLIPHFKKILLSAFECPHCGERNNEVQFAGELQPRGCHYQLNFPPDMLNRQVAKFDTATIKIPELDFEIPPEAQRGSLSTVEGILLRAVNEIEALQEERKKVDPQSAEAIDRFLPKLRTCAKGESSFTIILDDPAGNSFIENPVMTFPSTCFVELNKLTDIPYFREVIIMASSCDACGYRNSELKPGGRIPEKGKKIIVLVKNINDLSRDVIK
ncbi:unnamed protein product [Camellia sinensis]